MRTIVFDQGYNRVEYRNIVQLERAKLNHLLTEERRLIDILTRSAEKMIKSKPQILVDTKIIWRNIINHRLVQDVHRRLDCLTDAYPQFLTQVKAVRDSIKERFFAAIKTVCETVHAAVCHNNYVIR